MPAVPDEGRLRVGSISILVAPYLQRSAGWRRSLVWDPDGPHLQSASGRSRARPPSCARCPACGRMLGKAVVGLVNLLDLQMVLLEGKALGEGAYVYMREVEQALWKNLYPEWRGSGSNSQTPARTARPWRPPL